MANVEQLQADYQAYSPLFSKTYTKILDTTLFEIKNFCVQIATAYGIIYIQKSTNIPRIKAVVYCPNSDTYYVHVNDLDFLDYLLPRLQKFFLYPQFEFENFTMSCDIIDKDNFVLEVNINDESTILNNGFFKIPLITI